MKQWKSFPENVPTNSGYYMTVYYNFDHQEHFKKAIWWSKEKNEWTPWRYNNKPDLSQVKLFAPNTRADFYTSCINLTNEIITENPM